MKLYFTETITALLALTSSLHSLVVTINNPKIADTYQTLINDQSDHNCLRTQHIHQLNKIKYIQPITNTYSELITDIIDRSIRKRSQPIHRNQQF